NIVVAPDFQITDPRALRNRRRYRAIVDDTRYQFVAACLRQQNPYGALRDKWHTAGCTAEHFCSSDRLAFGKKHALLEILESPFELFFGFVGALFGGVDPVPPHYQTLSVLDR